MSATTTSDLTSVELLQLISLQDRTQVAMILQTPSIKQVNITYKLLPLYQYMSKGLVLEINNDLVAIYLLPPAEESGQ